TLTVLADRSSTTALRPVTVPGTFATVTSFDAAETAVVAPSCVSTSKRYAAPGVSPVMTTSRAEPAAVVPLPPSGRTTYRSAPEDAPVHATRTVPSSSAVALTPPAGVAGSGAAGGQSAVRTVVLATAPTPPDR